MIAVIDNFDSFTYNLVQLAYEFEKNIHVFRNNCITSEELDMLHPKAIIISPGPCYPSQAGISEDIINKLGDKYNILGICLGHQAICECFGASIVHAKKIMHGKKSLISINNKAEIFKGLPEKIEAARYHSLVAKRDNLPDSIEIIGEADEEIMAVRVKGKNIYGLQFHPESILSDYGKEIMKNFLNIKGGH